MKRMIRNASLLVAVTLTATACTRRVQVESEPNEPRYLESASVAPAQIDIVGVYDYVVEADGPVDSGPMTVTRTADGGYAVSATSSESGEAVATRNVRRNGNTLMMDATTPAGEGTVTLTWHDANRVTGEVFVGNTLQFRATRRQ